MCYIVSLSCLDCLAYEIMVLDMIRFYLLPRSLKRIKLISYSWQMTVCFLFLSVAWGTRDLWITNCSCALMGVLKLEMMKIPLPMEYHFAISVLKMTSWQYRRDPKGPKLRFVLLVLKLFCCIIRWAGDKPWWPSCSKEDYDSSNTHVLVGR